MPQPADLNELEARVQRDVLRMEPAVCPQCGAPLDCVRQYIGTEVRRVDELRRSQGGNIDVTVGEDIAEDSYDEILSCKIVCGRHCGFEALGVTIEGGQ